jgi:hypothetical protein
MTSRLPSRRMRRYLASSFTPWLQFAAKDFVGSPTMGYKTNAVRARCGDRFWRSSLARCSTASRGARSRLRPAPLPLYLLLGIAPIPADGLNSAAGVSTVQPVAPARDAARLPDRDRRVVRADGERLGRRCRTRSSRCARPGLTLESKLRRAGVEAQRARPALTYRLRRPYTSVSREAAWV